MKLRRVVVGALAVAWISGCHPAAPAPEPTVAEPYLASQDRLRPISRQDDERIRVLATSSILADVISQVGGDQIELQSLIPVGADPHAFEPTPQDARALAEADIVFINGFGLEAFMADLIVQAGGQPVVVSASLGIEPLVLDGEHTREPGEAEEDHADAGDAQGEVGAIDPHTWFDPNNVIQWTENILTALTAVDPGNAEVYAANAARYRSQLEALDAEIREAVERIPPERRKLVTDHEELGYFADEYGFEVIGTVLPGVSSLAEPSAREMAALFNRIRAEGVPAIFVTSVVSPRIAQRLADDVGVRLVPLYAHSLTDAAGPAPSYLELMRYNALTIAQALAP